MTKHTALLRYSLDKGNLDVLVDITEVDPSDYAWDSSSEFRPPVDGAVGIIRPEPMPIISFGALKAVAQDSNGNNRRVGIQLFWDGAVNGVDYVQYEVRKTETLETIYIGRTEEVPRASLIIAPGTLLLPNQSYQVRARYGTYDGNTEFIWSDWIGVITDDIRLGELDIYPINVGQLNKDIGDVLKELSETDRYVQEELDRIGALAVEQEAGTVSMFKLLREEAAVTAGDITAVYTKLVTVSIGPDSALAKRIETLETKIDDDVARAVSLLATNISRVDDKVAINTASITTLSAQMNDKAESSAMSLLAADISKVDDKVAINTAAITSLSAQMINKADSSAVSLLDAKVNQQGELITAHSSSITLLNSTVDNFSAEGLIRITSEATSGSALSRIAFRSYVEAMGRTSQAAMWLEAYSGSGGELFSRMVTIADQWIVTNGVDSAYPMTFINGRLTLQVASIGEVESGLLRSPDGKFVINLAEGYLRISR
ncbi:hypothetical protein [Pseudochrobactrum asaccharolyticum]|uniref:hypothetical protein n=1 Tax=Pseudochrobactrum asaccharolyticum TaxID=354351 RepID=UPI004041F66E